MRKDDILKILEDFMKHYDKMDNKAWETGNNRLGEYACAMWLICNRMRRTLKKEDAEDISMEDIESIVQEWKSRYTERYRTESEMRNSKSALSSIRSLIDSCEMLKNRLRTKFAHASKT